MESELIKGSDALRMSDSNFFPLLRIVGGNYYPLVFNNACSSWKSFALNFGCAGASVYIGTSTDILNSAAISVATKFCKAVSEGRAAGPALFQSQSKLTKEFGYTPYLIHGYIYTHFKRPGHTLSTETVVKRLLDTIRTASEEPDKTARSRMLSFLNEELKGVLGRPSGNRHG